LQVHKSNIGPQPAVQLDGLKAVACFANDLDFGHDSKQSD
jgi:hypothetical protein